MPGHGRVDRDEEDAGKSNNPENLASPQNHLERKPRKPTTGGLRDLRQASALLDAVAAISSQLEVRSVAQEAARQIAAFTSSDVCAISKWDRQRGVVVLWAEYRKGQTSPSKVPYLPYNLSEYPLTEKVLNSGKPVQIHLGDPKMDETEKLILLGQGANSLLMLPLFAQEHTIGLIEVFNSEAALVFSEVDIDHVLVLASHAGISIDRASLLAEAKQRASELEAIRRASLSLASSLDLQTVFTAILESALRLSHDVLDAHIFLHQDGELTFGAALWANGRNDTKWKQVREDGLTATVAKSGEWVMVEDVTKHPLYKDPNWLESSWKGSIVGLPLKIGEQVVGVMNVAYRRPQEFSEDRLRVLGLLGDQAALAIANARFYNIVSLQAQTDPLTGLANRRAFDQRLDEEIRRSNRYNHPFVLFMIDLDRFKKINDTYGHLMGDKALQLIAATISKSVRDTDFAARFGGDEFVLILPETKREHALDIAVKLTAQVEALPLPWKDSQAPLPLSLSIGIACYPEHAVAGEGLVEVADVALYQAKQRKDNPR